MYFSFPLHLLTLSSLSSLPQVCTVVVGYILAVVFLWSPSTQRSLRTLSVPVWAILLLFLGEVGEDRWGGDEEIWEKTRRQ